MTRAERVQFHLEKLLDQQEKQLFNYEPPKKQEFPLAFENTFFIRNKKQSVDAA